MEIADAITDVKKFVRTLYTKLKISQPNQIDLDYICERIGVDVRILPCDGKALLERRIVIIDSRNDALEQREQLAHEMSHVILHCGSQLQLPQQLIELQERQANNLKVELLVPMFMLHEMFRYTAHILTDAAIKHVAKEFQVTVTMAKSRMKKFEQLRWSEQFEIGVWKY